MQIRRAETEVEIGEVRALFRDYERELDVDLCFQSFEDELAELPGKYAPPEGELLIAIDGQNYIGCVALRSLSPEICEMKRLFVCREFRGQGIGRRLAFSIIDSAVRIGYRSMRLDTLDRLGPVLELYDLLGFKTIEAYYDNPLSGVVYLEKSLG